MPKLEELKPEIDLKVEFPPALTLEEILEKVVIPERQKIEDFNKAQKET